MDAARCVCVFFPRGTLCYCVAPIKSKAHTRTSLGPYTCHINPIIYMKIIHVTFDTHVCAF